VPSPVEGRLTRIKVPSGQTVPIGTALAELEVEGAAAVETPPSTPPESRPQSLRPPGADAGRIAPGVRKLLEENGLDIAQIPGTGAGGRVRREDVVAYLAARTPAAHARNDELVRISAVRRQIADHMVRSVSTSPHAWSLREVDASRLVEYREAEKEAFRERHGFALSYVPFFVQIVCDALMRNPFLNSTWTEDGIVLHHYVHMGIAVALPDALIVPVVRDADLMGFVDLARAINDLANRARTKALRPEDVRGGTFTLNNTGALGSVAGQSIINQPQAAILSTESIRKRPVVVDDEIVVRPIMNITMSFDHRIVDGLAASRFLNDVVEGVERWTTAKIRL